MFFEKLENKFRSVFKAFLVSKSVKFPIFHFQIFENLGNNTGGPSTVTHCPKLRFTTIFRTDMLSETMGVDPIAVIKAFTDPLQELREGGGCSLTIYREATLTAIK